MAKPKTYSRNIFSGKEIPFIGISEGHGNLFRGNSVSFSMNMTYSGAMESRNGMTRGAEYDGTIHVGFFGNTRGVCAGTSIFAEKV